MKKQKERIDPMASSQEEIAELGRRQGEWGLNLRPLKNGVLQKEI